MSEPALDATPISLPPPAPLAVPTTPATTPAATPAATQGITLDGAAPRLACDPPAPLHTTLPTPPLPTPPKPTCHSTPESEPPSTATGSTGYSLDGAAPRLASSATIAAVHREPEPVSETARPSASDPGRAATSPHLVSPVLNSPTVPTLPTSSGPTTPPAPHPTPANGHDSTPHETATPTSDEPVHPMAHLMPTKQSGPSEASRRAAEKRAIQKAKAKKVKVGVISAIVVVTAVVGPPLARWVIDAVNEAGTTTSVEEPAG